VVERERNHRDSSKKIVCVPAGTPDRNSQQDQSLSGALSGRIILSSRFRRLRFAPAPANIPRPSGAGNNFAEFASSIDPAATPSSYKS